MVGSREAPHHQLQWQGDSDRSLYSEKPKTPAALGDTKTKVIVMQIGEERKF